MMHFGLLLFPNLTQLDLTGPAEVFGACPDSKVHLIWKNLLPVATGRGWQIVPNATFADCPPLDVLCVPGGQGQTDLMEDDETLDFLRRQAAKARYVTSVCTGSLLLGAAGLLKGYRSTCHWASLEQLAWLGATPVAQRVVVDRNRISGGGVTAGIDFALSVVAELLGINVARRIQLGLEYDPQPPFQAGSPESAGPRLVAELEAFWKERQEQRRQATRRAAQRLGL